MKLMRILMVVLISLLSVPAFAQQPTEATMSAVRDAVKAQKRAFVAVNMQLTKEEETKFWPIYDSYQNELQAVNKKAAEIINEYAKGYETLTDAQAQDLIKRYLSYEEELISLRKSYLKKFMEVIPAKKTARYYQMENKIQAVIRYDLAENIPLVK